jgi:hypothetical protein
MYVCMHACMHVYIHTYIHTGGWRADVQGSGGAEGSRVAIECRSSRVERAGLVGWL